MPGGRIEQVRLGSQPILPPNMRLRRIDSPWMEGVAFANPNQPPQTTMDSTVLENAAYKVFATGGLKATPRPQERTDQQLIALHPGYDQRGRNPQNGFPEFSHRSVFHGFLTPSRVAILVVKTSKLSARSTSSGTSCCRGITTQSTPAGMFARCSRNASRRALFHRLRRTDEPTFLDTESPSLAYACLFSAP